MIGRPSIDIVVCILIYPDTISEIVIHFLELLQLSNLSQPRLFLSLVSNIRPIQTRSSRPSFETHSNHIMPDWESSAEIATSPGATTPPTGLASTWSDFMPSTSSQSNMLEPDFPQTSLSSNILSMDPIFLESIAFSLEQFPPEPNSWALAAPMDGLTSNNLEANSLHLLSAFTMPFSNMDPSVAVRGPQQFTPSPDYATAFALPEPRDLRPASQKKAHTAASARSLSPSSQESDEDRLQEKRRRNKLAARRLRQKKMDQVSDLESKLEELTKERDDLRLKAAKWEGEVMVLRQLLGRETVK